MTQRALTGLKVADFSWVGVGPITMRFLAEHGATVVRVESRTRPEALRMSPPFKAGVPGLDRALTFSNCNVGKYGLSLDLNRPEARDVAARLVQWADVVAESFTPGTTKKWGLDYETISKTRPDIVMLSTCQQGQTGPHARYGGYGGMSTALCGFYSVTGWADREPVGPYGPYTDFITPPLGAAVVLAALDYRRRTGKGQHLDVSQFECGLQYLAPALLDYAVNGRIMGRAGNHEPHICPQGVYPSTGEDRWIAISVTSDAEWEALCDNMGHREWLADPRFATFLARNAHEDVLDTLIGEWTRTQDAARLMERLQRAGVPAGMVARCSDLHCDPQLSHQGHWVTLDHSEMGPTVHNAMPFRLSRTPGSAVRGGPCLGEHTEHVLRKFLAYGDGEIDNLRACGALD